MTKEDKFKIILTPHAKEQIAEMTKGMDEEELDEFQEVMDELKKQVEEGKLGQNVEKVDLDELEKEDPELAKELHLELLESEVKDMMHLFSEHEAQAFSIDVVKNGENIFVTIPGRDELEEIGILKTLMLTLAYYSKITDFSMMSISMMVHESLGKIFKSGGDLNALDKSEAPIQH